MSSVAFTLRCPHCLAQVDVSPGMSGGTLAQNQLPDPTYSALCPDCGNTFRLADALPVAARSSDIDSVLIPGKPDMGQAGVLASVAVGAAMVVGASLLAADLDGPAFLALYAIAGVLLLGATWVVRLQYREQLTAMLVGCVSFEAIGVIRYVAGSAHGMHKWTYMAVMMVIGGLLFFVSGSMRGGGGDGSSGGWWGSNCSGSGGGGCGGGGSCGGGGCGGGGCGGCGGS